MLDSEVLQGFGQVAGIGGLGLGVFLYLFREIIRKNIFANLGKEYSYRLLRQISYLVWSVGIVGMLIWLYVETITQQDVIQSSVGTSSPNISEVNGSVSVSIESD